MFHTPDLESLAIQRFHQRWRERELQAGRGLGDMRRLYTEVHTMTWLIRDLLELVADQSDRPVADLEPTIRRVVCEHDLVYETGDADVAKRRDRIRERMVHTLIEVFEDVRREAQAEGAMPSAPASVPMCG